MAGVRRTIPMVFSVLVVAALAASTVSVPSRAVETPPVTWGPPQLAVPTTTNSGGFAQVTSVSCSSAGTCAAGGFYSDGASFQAFVVSQTAGVWGTPQLAVPTTTNIGNNARVNSVSCSSAGNCVAGGSYSDGTGRQAFVVSQTAGLWGPPQLAVPTTTNIGNNARVTSVSCSSAGNCAAGGSYTDGAGQQAFVVSQTAGLWGTHQLAVPVTTNSGGSAEVNSVSCTSAGNCAAGGFYSDGLGSQAFVVSQTAGVWGTPQLAVPATTNSGNAAWVTSVSCSSTGNCAAGGYYTVGLRIYQAFVVSQTAGVWGTPQLAVPTTTNSGGSAYVTSVSCSSAGNCAAGGSYSDGELLQAFVVNEDRATFADVGPTNPFYTFVQWMASSGISTGTAQPSGKPLYKPADAVSRQAMALFMYRLSGETFVPPASSTFADVATTSQFYTAVEWMFQRSISTGTAQPSGKPLFKPSDPVSRQAMALFVARYAGANLATPPTTQRFADVPLNAGTAAAIDWMFTTGISTGTAQPSGLPLYRPTNPVSRQAMAAFLFRVDGLP